MQRLASITNDNPLDKIGVIASCACAVHCTLAPLLVAVLPLLGLRFLADECTEWLFAGTSIVIGVASLLPSYLRHKRTRSLALFALGLSLILTARIIVEGNLAVEVPILVIGALFVSLSHVINRKLCQSCVSCASAVQPNKP